MNANLAAIKERWLAFLDTDLRCTQFLCKIKGTKKYCCALGFLAEEYFSHIEDKFSFINDVPYYTVHIRRYFGEAKNLPETILSYYGLTANQARTIALYNDYNEINKLKEFIQTL